MIYDGKLTETNCLGRPDPCIAVRCGWSFVFSRNFVWRWVACATEIHDIVSIVPPLISDHFQAALCCIKLMQHQFQNSQTFQLKCNRCESVSEEAQTTLPLHSSTPQFS